MNYQLVNADVVKKQDAETITVTVSEVGFGLSSYYVSAETTTMTIVVVVSDSCVAVQTIAVNGSSFS